MGYFSSSKLQLSKICQSRIISSKMLRWSSCRSIFVSLFSQALVATLIELGLKEYFFFGLNSRIQFHISEFSFQKVVRSWEDSNSVVVKHVKQKGPGMMWSMLNQKGPVYGG